MRKLASASLLAVALLLIFAAPSLAGGRGHRHHGHHFHGGGRVFIGVGPAFWWGYPYGYPYYYYPPPYYYTPPPVVIQEPPVYVQQQVTPTVPPAPPAASDSYWYYCPSARDYYPNVPTCSEAWIKVPPRQD